MDQSSGEEGVDYEPFNSDNDPRSFFALCNVVYKLGTAIRFSYYHWIATVDAPKTLRRNDLYVLKPSKQDLEQLKKLKVKCAWDTKRRLGRDWMKAIYEMPFNDYYYLDRSTNLLHRTSTSVARLKGGFMTRSMATAKGIMHSDDYDFNERSTSLSYANWPIGKIHQSGEKGHCSLIAAYAICDEMNLEDLDSLKVLLSIETRVNDSEDIWATDGTYTMIKEINSILTTTFFKRIYTLQKTRYDMANQYSHLGDLQHCGKFLVEICDYDYDTLEFSNISHFVGINTENMHIYDPMCANGAIVGIRDSSGTCLLIESLGKSPKQIAIVNVWKLMSKDKDNMHTLQYNNTFPLHALIDENPKDEVENVECMNPKKRRRKGGKKRIRAVRHTLENHSD